MAAKKGPGGRPSKLTEETKKALYQGIQAGLSYRLACEAAGIGYSTLRDWINIAERIQAGAYTGKDAIERDFSGSAKEYSDFLDGLKEAEARGALQLVSIIRRAANEGYWQAGAWILERRHKEDFGRTVTNEVTGPDGGPVKQEVEHRIGGDERSKRFADLFGKLDAYRTGFDDGYREGDRGEPLHPRGADSDPA